MMTKARIKFSNLPLEENRVIVHEIPKVLTLIYQIEQKI